MIAYYLKRGFTNTAIYTIGSIAMRGISFSFLPYFLSKLTLEEMGHWDFYQTFFSLSVLLLSSCAATSMFRFYFAYKDQEPEKAHAVIGNALLATTLLSSCIASILALLWAAGTLHTFTLLTGINSILFACFSLCITYLRMKEMLVWYLVVFCSQSLLSLGGTVIAVSYGYGIHGFFYATTASLLLYVPFFITLWQKNAVYSWSLAREQLTYSGPLLIYNLLYAGFFSIDRIIIGTYGSFELLGTYGLLWRFGAIFQMFSVALIDAVQLVACDAYEKINTEDLQSIMHGALGYLISAACFASIGTTLIVRIWLPGRYAYLTNYTAPFFGALIMLEIARFFNIGFMLSKNTFPAAITSAIILLIQASALYVLIPYGIWGIISALLVSFTSYAALNYSIIRSYSRALFDQKITIALITTGSILLIISHKAPYSAALGSILFINMLILLKPRWRHALFYRIRKTV